MDNSIISTVFNLTKSLDKKFDTGIEKRDELYKMLRTLMGEDKFNENKSTIDCILETTIFISKICKLSGINENSFRYCCK